MSRVSWCAAAIAAAVLAVPLFGGEIRFKNGDKLTGKVSSPEEGKLTVESPFAGKVTVKLEQVESFTTDEPIAVTLTDGTVKKGPVTATTEPVVAPATAETAPGAGAPAAVAAAPVGPIARASVANVAPPTKEQPWKGEILVGGQLTTGNTETKQLSVSAEAVKRRENDRTTLNARYMFGRQRDNDTGDDQTTTDNWLASAKYDYFVTKKLYLYGLVRVEQDRIAELNLRVNPNAGLGYQWHEGPTWNFSTELGLGWTYEDFENDGSREYVNARAAYHYDRKLFENVSFVHNLEYLPSLEDVEQFIVNADAGVRADLTKSMFADFKVQWTYNANPAPGAEKNDTRYIASLGWRF